MSDRIEATAWIENDGVPDMEGDRLQVFAHLCDVDEIALVLADGDHEIATVHLDRVHAIALAGQLASAATTSHVTLPSGHGPTGPAA